MPSVPPDQRSPYPGSRTSAATAASNQDKRDDGSPHQCHGDRGSDDSGEAKRKAERAEAKLAERRSKLVQTGFPVFLRYDDLVAAGIVANWTTLLRLIDDEGFPPGTMIGRNMRAWRLDEVEEWLVSRPSARKILPPNAVRKRRAAAEAQP